MTIWRMRIACWITKDTLTLTHTHTYTHSLTICNGYCFSTATEVARGRLDVTSERILPVFLKYRSKYIVIYMYIWYNNDCFLTEGTLVF
jgi:hypothetical protein